MNKRSVAILLLLSLRLAGSGALAQTSLSPQGFVSDFAGVLSGPAKTDLEGRLARLEKETGVEIAVVTVGSLEGATIEDYAARLFESWSVGKKGEDNGLLFLVAPTERKARIEVGYGLEPVLTDAQAGRLLDQYVIPRFKEGDLEAGIVAGTLALIAAVGGGALPSAPTPEKEVSGKVWFWIFIFGMLAIEYLLSFLARSKSFWAGGVLGGVGGLILGFILGSAALALATALGLGIIGLILDYLLSRNYKRRWGRGLPTSFWRSLGGFSGSGGSGGGGFGGFGGGGSGGGGSSRGW